MMKLKIKKLHPDAVTPEYATPGAACFDLVAIDDGCPHPSDALARIYRTGLAFEVPPGWALEIHSRSGHGFKNAIRLSNCTGIIDSDYRGELLVALHADGVDSLVFKAHAFDRIAQAKLVPAPQVEFELVEDLSDTARGSGGFGSTGV